MTNSQQKIANKFNVTREANLKNIFNETNNFCCSIKNEREEKNEI